MHSRLIHLIIMDAQNQANNNNNNDDDVVDDDGAVAQDKDTLRSLCWVLLYGIGILFAFNYIEISDYNEENIQISHDLLNHSNANVSKLEQRKFNAKQFLNAAEEVHASNKTTANANHLETRREVYEEANDALQDYIKEAKKNAGLFSSICFEEIGSTYTKSIAQNEIYDPCHVSAAKMRFLSFINVLFYVPSLNCFLLVFFK